ncbi:MAG: GHKL domain-containing protein [Anaerostipes sp.]|nr:GHKL domain-containing protein [Anaerostipes sp.]
MKILRDLSVLWSLFHILILFILLYRSRYPRKKTFVLTGVFMAPLIVLNVAGLILYGPEFMGKIFLITCTLPSFIFFWFMSEDRKGQFFFTFCLADTVSYWILAATNLLDFYFGGEKYILMFIGRLVLFPLIEWAAVRYLRKPYRELQKSAARGWGLFAVMSVLYYLLLAVMANYPVIITGRPQELPVFLLVMTLMPMTYATILVAMYRQLLFFRKQQSERILLEQKNSLEARLENQQRIRKMKHDMKGYTATLSGLLAEGKTEDALTYLKGVEAETDVLLKPFCPNPYINAVFVHYAGKFEEMGAVFKHDIQIGDEELPYMELCQIVSNGLENACDALKELEKGQREAAVYMKYNREYLLIRIKNKCRSDLYVERGTIPATGKEGGGHGYGLATVKEAAERLDGDMFCYASSGMFILDVLVASDTFPGGKRQEYRQI